MLEAICTEIDLHVCPDVISTSECISYMYAYIKHTYQGSPQEKFKAERVDVVWAGFVTTSIILVTTSEKYDY